MSEERIVKLKPFEGEAIEVSLESALMSLTIKDMFHALDVDSDSEDEAEVPLPNIAAKTLVKIVEWCETKKNTRQPTSEEIKDKIEETIDPWDEDFVKMELTDLYLIVSISITVDRFLELKFSIS